MPGVARGIVTPIGAQTPVARSGVTHRPVAAVASDESPTPTNKGRGRAPKHTMQMVGVQY